MVCKEKMCTTDVCLSDNSNNNVYVTRLVYNSKVNPSQIDALMAKKSKNVKTGKHISHSVQGRQKTIIKNFRLFVTMGKHVRSM